MKQLYLLLCLLGVYLLGCQETVTVSTPIVQVATASATAVPTLTPPILPTETATQTATVPPTTTPPNTPTTTPRPLLLVGVPTQWLEVAETAVAQLNQTETAWQWQITPQTESANGQAYISLVHHAEGQLVWQEPIVLTVPFTYNWFEASEEETQRILAGNHPIAHALPWSQMTPDQKVLRVQGMLPAHVDYPLQDSWSLVATVGYETAVPPLLAALQNARPAEPVIELAAVGDIMLNRSLGYVIKEQNSPQYPFFNVAPILTAADITVGNLECALGDVGQPVLKSYTFQAPPEAVAALQLGGFDVVSLANNHAMDYGPEALLQGISLLQAGGIAPIGAGATATEARAPHITQVNGLTVAFLGYVHVPIEANGSFFDTQSWTATDTAPGLAWAEPAVIEEDVTAVRSAVDLVVVVLHSGFEYIEEPSEAQMAAAHAAIDAGADIVIGHHAHILQGIEFYQQGVIVYGLGNFAFEIDGDPSTAILQVWLDQNGVRQLEITPAIIQFGGQPRLAEPWEAGPILQQIYYLTTVVNIPNQ